MITQAGKEQLTGYKKQYQDLMASDVNQEGKKAVNISFKDVNVESGDCICLRGNMFSLMCGLLGVDLVNIRFHT